METVKINEEREEIHPNPNIIEALKFIDKNLNKEKKLKALDIGAGDGKDSLFLAKKEFVVSAIDTSTYFIHKINQLARIHNIDIRTSVTDFLTYNFEDYDLLICNNVIHFLQLNQIKVLINKMRNHTLPNGLNIIGYLNNDILKDFNLKEIYANWDLLYYNDNIIPSSDKKKFIELIAKKK